MWAILAVSLLLALATAALYWPAAGFDFVGTDDASYVTENEIVCERLTGRSVLEAFSSARNGYWIPLTWLSFMVDRTLFGMHASAFHRTNIILHAAVVALVFVVGVRATGSFWKSLFAAALFGAHPLRVESVAWISERKDVLSGLFFVMGIGAYIRYVDRRGWTSYAAVGVLMTLGLMAKPIVVVFPLALLLLDFWPLGRLGPQTLTAGRSDWGKRLLGLLAEKAPLFLLAAAASILTFYVQPNVGSLSEITAGQRLTIFATSFAHYLNKSFWPVDLVLEFSQSQVKRMTMLSAILLFCEALTVSWLAFRFRKRLPAFTFGWFWFVATLLPVCGILPAGVQLFSDRFTYLPHLGLAVAAAWATAELAAAWPRLKPAVVLISVAVLVALVQVSRIQLQHWRNTESLVGNLERVLGPWAYSQVMLGVDFGKRGELSRALQHFERAIEIDPAYGEAHYNRGVALQSLQRFVEAEMEYRYCLQLNPTDYQARVNLQRILAAMQSAQPPVMGSQSSGAAGR